MQSQVTIVLPVYNVEPYLRECLDSVINQTLREIQIICVNDGSTDGSPAILEEYATRDSRIEIIHQENRGGGSARNAAYPFIRGNYTYFVDPDDWIDLKLCEKAWNEAETSQAEIVFLNFINTKTWKSSKFNPSLPKIRQTPESKHELLRLTSTARKFWRTDFLLSHQVVFSEGKRPYNDNLPSWKGIVLADKIALLNEPLYFRRIRPGSYQQSLGKSHFIFIDTMQEVAEMLKETGFYQVYRDLFEECKLNNHQRLYSQLPWSIRSSFFQLVRESLTEDDRTFYRDETGKMKRRVLSFYRGLIDGQRLETMKYYFLESVKWAERCFRHWVVQPLQALIDNQSNETSSSDNIIPLPSQGIKDTHEEGQNRHVA